MRKRGMEWKQVEEEAKAGTVDRRQTGEQDAAAAATRTAPHPSTGPPSAASPAPAPAPASALVQPLPEQFPQTKRQRRSPRFACWMDMLALVELQLCMHWLTNGERLVAARVSRRMLAAVSAPFSWRDAEPYVVSSKLENIGARVRSSLVRLAPLHLRWESPLSLASLVSLPSLRGLEQQWYGSGATTEQWHRLLASPAVTTLQELRRNIGTSDTTSLELIGDLPSLHTLELQCPPVASADYLRPLVASQSLTSLLCHGYSYFEPATWLGSLHQLTRLRHLSLSDFLVPAEPGLAAGQPRVFFRQLADLTELQELKLSDFKAVHTGNSSRAPTVAEWRMAFESLPQLRVLRLGLHVYGLDSLLPHLPLAASLRLLVLTCQSVSYPVKLHCQRHPSPPVLHALLAAAPRLQVQLRAPATWNEWQGDPSLLTAAQVAVIWQQWEELQSLAGTPRVQLVHHAERRHTAALLYMGRRHPPVLMSGAS